MYMFVKKNYSITIHHEKEKARSMVGGHDDQVIEKERET